MHYLIVIGIISIIISLIILWPVIRNAKTDLFGAAKLLGEDLSSNPHKKLIDPSSPIAGAYYSEGATTILAVILGYSVLVLFLAALIFFALWGLYHWLIL